MNEELQLRIHGDAALPTLIYLPGLHGDWTLVTSFRLALAGRVRFVEFTYPRTLMWSLEDYARAIEAALAGAFPHYGLRCQVAVLTRPDEDKGEALIAVTNEPKLTLAEIREAIKAKGLTNLCVPKEIKFVREIPKLGTGKVNHRELQKIINESK